MKNYKRIINFEKKNSEAAGRKLRTLTSYPLYISVTFLKFTTVFATAQDLKASAAGATCEMTCVCLESCP